MNIRKFLTITAITAASIAVGGAVSHADTSTATDPCRAEGNGTIIAGNLCGPGTPTLQFICSHGYAHAIVGDTDYCPAPAVVTVGESEFGTTFVPHIFAPTRLDVAMRRTSLQSMRFRCAHMGGTRLVASHGFYVCHGVDY